MMKVGASIGSRTAFLRGLIGRRYEVGALGPDAFDCFGLVAHVSAALFERPVPREADEILAARRRFLPAAMPVDGALVLMRAGDRHVGIWLADDGGGVLHAIERRGVVFDNAFSLALTGFGRPRFFNPR